LRRRAAMRLKLNGARPRHYVLENLITRSKISAKQKRKKLRV